MYKKLDSATTKILEELVKQNGLINIDLNLFNQSAPGELVGLISTSINNLNDIILVDKKSDLEPTELIIKIIAKSDLSLLELDQIINNIKSLYPNIKMIFGMAIDDQESLCMIKGILISRK